MRRFLILTLCLFAGLTGCAQAPQNKSEKTVAQTISKEPKIVLSSSDHNFGRIDSKGKPVTYIFEFTNTGQAPLVITRVTTTCTCTKISHTRKPVKTGEKGTITVTYDPKNQKGVFAKTIQVFSNSGDKKALLTIKGEVF